MNISEGVALCPACGTLTRLSDLVAGADEPSDRGAGDLAELDPVAGCTVTGWPDDLTLRASARSFGSAVGMLFIVLFWNGIVSVFVLLALAGLYINLIGPLPAWFPAPTQSNGGGPIPLNMALFLCVFLIPFVVVGTGLMIAFLFSVFGSVVVTLKGDEGVVATGFGPLRWRKRFNTRKVKRVWIGRAGWEKNDQPQKAVCIEADRDIRFASMLPSERKRWLSESLQALLLHPDSPRAQQLLSQGQTSWPG